jgi:fibronectin-binding autotransporter adhesin
MKTRAALALPWILAVCGVLSASDTRGGEPPMAQDPPSAYDSWETANGIAGAGAHVDSDGDGISNGIEFVIGGDPSGPGSDSNSLLPVVTVDEETLYFTFRMTDAAKVYGPLVEYSSSLGQWATAYPGVDGVVIVEDAGSEVTLVTMQIPRTLGFAPPLFARLRVDTSPPIDP